MNVKIRHTIAYKLYDDIDMVNAHFVILYNLCKNNNIKAKNLKYYIDNRNNLYNALSKSNNISKQECKMLIICILYGGFYKYYKLKYKPKWLLDLIKEINIVVRKICNLYPNLFVEKKVKNKSKKIYSHISYILTTYENLILNYMCLYFLKNSIINNTFVLCFDGIMIPKNTDILVHLKNCEKFIQKEINFSINLIVKPMNNYLFNPDKLKNDKLFYLKTNLKYLYFKYFYNNVYLNICYDKNIILFIILISLICLFLKY